MMVPTKRGQVRFTGPAALRPRGGVVQVAAGGGTAAARRGTRGVAGADQVSQGPGGVVADSSVGVVAGTPGDGGQRGGQEAGRPGARWCGAGWRVVAG